MNVACVVLRSGMALLVRHPPGSPHAGKWGFPGGTVAAGETPAKAAARHMREQFGIDAAVGPEVARSIRDDGEILGLLVPQYSGDLKPVVHDRILWVESRRVLEHELVAIDVPIAEVVTAHRRRDRYKGTHPRTFSEKYKELREDPEALAQAKSRGSTPAGLHVPIMVSEVLDSLSPLSGATILDCTLGSGGHAEHLFRAAQPHGRVIGLDRDAEELTRTKRRLTERGVAIVARHSNYADARTVLDGLALDGVDALFADLGVSSMQLDRPERGMSFKNSGALDMRMDRSSGSTVAQWLTTASQSEISEVLSRYGDEPDADKIAAHLVALAAEGRTPKTTLELAAAVTAVKGLGEERAVKKNAFSKHPAARMFQALRIAINSEHESLRRLLEDLPRLLRPGGRASFLTFHSGEEGLVREALTSQLDAGIWRSPLSSPRPPSVEEIRENPRARSARLWSAQKL